MTVRLTESPGRPAGMGVRGRADQCAAAPMSGQEPVVLESLNPHQLITALHQTLQDHRRKQRQQCHSAPMNQLRHQPWDQTQSQQSHHPGLGITGEQPGRRPMADPLHKSDQQTRQLSTSRTPEGTNNESSARQRADRVRGARSGAAKRLAIRA